jgi:hypothetical protein
MFFLAMAFLGENYLLNKTVREISLRLVQIRRLSRTRNIDYKVVIGREQYNIDYLDIDDMSWKRYIQSKYRNGVLGELDGAELIFSKGRFKGYRWKGRETEFSDYIIMNFYSPKSQKKKAIILYRNGDWKALI